MATQDAIYNKIKILLKKKLNREPTEMEVVFTWQEAKSFLLDGYAIYDAVSAAVEIIE
jgi:hypothetical protein